MAVQGDAVIWTLEHGEIEKLCGLQKYNATRKAAGDLKNMAQQPGFCPVRTGKLRSEHKVVYLGGSDHAVIADTYYAYWVHEGAQGRKANRWLNRATDAIHGRPSL